MPEAVDSTSRELTAIERELGMGESTITRRDFVNAVLIGAGATLLQPGALAAAGPASSRVGPAIDSAEELAFNGPPGIGDYAHANGNTWRVLQSAHQIRDGAYTEAIIAAAREDDEQYDLVVVGGGAAGLGAAHRYLELGGRPGKCLLLDNHAVPGGEAKQNDFIVNGQRLIAPQGSNALFMPTSEAAVADAPDDFMAAIFKKIGFPLDYEYARLTGTRKPLQFDISNYFYLWFQDHSDSVGLYFDDDVFGHGRRWVSNPWARELHGCGVPETLRRELVRWRHGLSLDRPAGPRLEAWLDSMTYRQLLVDVHKLPAAVADFTEPLVASSTGLGSSVVSAYCATRRLDMPGAERPDQPRHYRDLSELSFFDGKARVHCFPGGNAGIARAFLKALNPAAIEGSADISDILTQRIAFTALDTPSAPVRIRGSATVVDVRHQPGARDKRVIITYERDGILRRITARNVVMAGGGWINKHVVRDLPAPLREAFDREHYSTVLVANVALTNWRFLERLGITACVYTGGEFGFSCNIRRPMHLQGYEPPLDPNEPTVLTFYAPLTMPGLDARTQGAACRALALGTPFREYERRIRSQMVRLFGGAGFDPARDIAGITLNRWGHAYVVPEPGFFIGTPDRPTPGEVIRRGFGRIAFGSASLRGYQNFRGGVYEGRRAVEQLLS